jgi:hypothetical protein
MKQLKKVSQSLDGCLSSIQDALDALEQIGEDNQLSAEICEAITDRIFLVIEELDYCELFIKRLSKCKNQSEMETIVKAGME